MGASSMCRGRFRGFTLVELLVVVTIIALLIALLLPAVQAAREAARRAGCMNNVKQIGLGMNEYHNLHNLFPINVGNFPDCPSYNSATDFSAANYGQSWITGILPYVEQQPLYERIHCGQPLSNSDNDWASRQPINLLLCPSDNSGGTMNNRSDFAANVPRGVTNYKACAGANWHVGDFAGISSSHGRWAKNTNGLFYGNGLMCANYCSDIQNYTSANDVTDGLSNTFAVGEAVPAWCNWTWWYWFNATTATCGIPLNYRKGTVNLEAYANTWSNNYSFFSRHPGGAHFAMVDGAVKFVQDNINITTYRALSTIAGEEQAQLPP